MVHQLYVFSLILFLAYHWVLPDCSILLPVPPTPSTAGTSHCKNIHLNIYIHSKEDVRCLFRLTCDSRVPSWSLEKKKKISINQQIIIIHLFLLSGFVDILTYSILELSSRSIMFYWLKWPLFYYNKFLIKLELCKAIDLHTKWHTLQKTWLNE